MQERKTFCGWTFHRKHAAQRRLPAGIPAWCLVCILFAVSCSAVPAADTADTVPAAATADAVLLRSEVRIVSGALEGKGTLIAGEDNSEYVVSAAHLAEEAGSDALQVYAGDLCIDCVPVYTDPVLDLGIWKSTGEKTGRTASVLQDGSVKTGERQEQIFCAGVTDGSIRTGYIAGRDVTVSGNENRYLYLMLETEPGMSGSGIYSSAGQYMGTLTASLDTGGCLAVPAETVLEIIGSLEEMKK